MQRRGDEEGYLVSTVVLVVPECGRVLVINSKLLLCNKKDDA